MVRAFWFIERENEVLLILSLISENVQRIALVPLRVIQRGEPFLPFLNEANCKIFIESLF